LIARLEGLLVAGRGISMVNGVFAPTDILETLTQRGTHPLNRLPVDDNSHLCYIGGGEWNVRAGAEVCKRLRPRLVAFAYGDTRTKEFIEAGAPYEGPVMVSVFTRLLREKGLKNMEVRTWTTHNGELCNSRREIRQFLELACAEAIRNVGIVTVMVHMPRVQMFVAELQQESRFAGMEVQFFTSETELMTADPATYGPQIAAMLRSRAFARNWARELEGIAKVANGEYSENKPRIKP